MKPEPRDIERSQPTGAFRPDPGAGLREHVEGREPKTTASLAPQEDRAYVWDIRNHSGVIIRSVPPEFAESARQDAEQMRGFVTLAPVVWDFREQA